LREGLDQVQLTVFDRGVDRAAEIVGSRVLPDQE
jgi:hypothetical protein